MSQGSNAGVDNNVPPFDTESSKLSLMAEDHPKVNWSATENSLRPFAMTCHSDLHLFANDVLST